MIRVQNEAFQFKLKSTKVESRRVINNIFALMQNILKQ